MGITYLIRTTFSNLGSVRKIRHIKIIFLTPPPLLSRCVTLSAISLEIFGHKNKGGFPAEYDKFQLIVHKFQKLKIFI